MWVVQTRLTGREFGKWILRLFDSQTSCIPISPDISLPYSVGFQPDGQSDILHSSFPGHQSAKFSRVSTRRTVRHPAFQFPRTSVCQIQSGFNPTDIKTSYIPVAPDFSPGERMLPPSSGFSPRSFTVSTSITINLLKTLD